MTSSKQAASGGTRAGRRRMAGSGAEGSPSPRQERPRTYRRILVPLDGTLFAEASLIPAAALATRAGASLDLVSVVARDASALDLGDAVEMAQPGSPEFAERLTEYVERVREGLEAEWGCEVTVAVLPDGDSADSLRSYVDRTGIDITIAATHAEDIATRAVLGRLSRALSREAPCPLLLIPAREGRQHDRSDPLHGPVLSVAAVLGGGREADGEVVRNAVRMARLWNAPLHVLALRPADPDARTADGATGGMLTEARALELVREIGGKDLDVDAEALAGGHVAEDLVDVIGELQVDLLCVGRVRDETLDRLLRSRPPGGLEEGTRQPGVLICACP